MTEDGRMNSKSWRVILALPYKKYWDPWKGNDDPAMPVVGSGPLLRRPVSYYDSLSVGNSPNPFIRNSDLPFISLPMQLYKLDIVPSSSSSPRIRVLLISFFFVNNSH